MAKGAGLWRNLRLGRANGCLLLLCEVGDAALEQRLEASRRALRYGPANQRISEIAYAHGFAGGAQPQFVRELP